MHDVDPEKLADQRMVLSKSLLRVDEPSLAAQVFRSRQPRLIPVIDLDQSRATTKPEYVSLMQRHGVHSRIVVPMQVRGQIIGILGLYRHERGRPAFDEDDLVFAQDLADRAALAISNAQLYLDAQSELGRRWEAEQSLRESEEHLRTVTETAQLGLVMVDQQHRYRYANRAYAAIFNLPAAEIAGQRVADVLAPVYEGQIRPRLERAFGGERVSYELVIPTAAADQRDRFYGVTYEPGMYRLEPVVIVVVAEITERKQAELGLARSARRLQVLADASHAFTEAGTQYQPLLDQVTRTITEVLGEGCAIRLLSEDAQWLPLVALYDVDPELMELQRSALSATPLRVDEASLTTRAFHSRQSLMIPVVDMEAARAATKPEYWSLMERMGVHSMLVAPMRVHGHVIGVLVVNRHLPGQPSFTDDDRSLVQDLADRAALAISNARLLNQVQRELAERTRAEAEVRLLSAELEQRVSARTAELTIANRELEAFSYSVSHDLRAPLRAIDGFSRILLDEYVESLPSEAQHYFDLIRGNAQRMGQLVDDLLAFSRLSRQQIRKQTLDPAVLIAQCLIELRAEQEGRSLAIQIGELPSCSADPALLKQVWVNLLANALKYTRPRDPAKITVDSIIQGAETVYRITDNGVGFDMRYVDKLFGVFQRLHRAEEFEGTGVGLAIVQRIVQRHGGHIWAEAEVDRGATFAFTLGGAAAEPA
jgi:PAS domain S-box-containing protein